MGLQDGSRAEWRRRSQASWTGCMEGKASKQKPGKALLAMSCGGYMSPHPAKVDSGGEDAFFVSPAALDTAEPWLGAAGVADGVGGWGEDGVDPGDYARKLMQACKSAAGPPAWRTPQQVLEYAQLGTELPGSATACVLIQRADGRLAAANLGDCGFRIIRNGKVVAKSEVQQHEFNMPYQLACPKVLPETDLASDADLYEVDVEDGDVVVLGSDGLFDNMWDEQLVGVVTSFVGKNTRRSSEDAATLAERLASAAAFNAGNAEYRSPWAVSAANAGVGSLLTRLFPRGGKLDDTTVIVAFMNRRGT
uniref:Protein phosphatase n=1 Tax=Tetraselmis sp. GSL018 TaxID=582737 RepID=A0A061R614_9CHLO